MTVIVCLDNANGMMFNHRRQSRDANVVKDILKTINGASLLIAPYPSCSSVKQMSDKNKQTYTGSRDDLISQGYDPCKKCNP